MISKAFKAFLLLSILIGIHQTVRVHVHHGVYTIQDTTVPIQNFQKLKINMDNQRISVEGGCNILTSSYTVRDGQVVYGPWASTRRFCDDDKDSQILAAFQSTAKISAYAGKIYLYDSKGEKILKLKKME